MLANKKETSVEIDTPFFKPICVENMEHMRTSGILDPNQWSIAKFSKILKTLQKECKTGLQLPAKCKYTLFLFCCGW